jgi:DNA-binding transcriptional LysR family regulator
MMPTTSHAVTCTVPDTGTPSVFALIPTTEGTASLSIPASISAGTSVADLAETIDRGVEELERTIGGEDGRPEGVVKLATTDTVAGFLMAGLIPLRNEHPKIQVQLVVGNAAQDLLRKEADVAVRMYRDQNPSLVARKIGDIGWSLYAARGFV